MRYPDELIEEVRRRNDIVDVISTYVALRQKGNNYFGICPFHDEKTGSFSVAPSKQMFYCFGCHEGGDVISFIQKQEKMTFPEAIRLLAARAGVEITEVSDHEDKETGISRIKLTEINANAARYYSELLQSEAGWYGMKYLKNRGVSDETIRRFDIGYAKQTKDDLYRFLKAKGYTDERLRNCGLFNFSEGKGVTDKFWNRVMFPITDAEHKVVGFGGRIIDEGSPKYLNSPETPVFDKSKTLYGLDIAKTSKEKNLIICEGFMDVIALHQAGFDQAVATLGTAFTQSHATLVEKYSKISGHKGEMARYKDILLCFDSDNAGIDAIKRAILTLHEVGLRAKVINLTPYKDPDEFIKELGAEEFQRRVNDAENGFFYEIRQLESEYDMKDPSGKSRFIMDVASRLLRFKDAVERDNYSGLIAYKYDVSVDSLNKTIEGLTKPA